MSTILKALKKAEQASCDHHSRIDDRVGFRSRTQAGDSSERRGQSRALGWVGVAAGVVLVLTVTAIYLFRSGASLPLPDKTPAAAALTAGDPPGAHGNPEPVGPEPGMASNPGPRPAPLQALAQKPASVPLPEKTHASGLTPASNPPLVPVLSYQPFDPKTMSAPVRMVPDKPAAGPVPHQPEPHSLPPEDLHFADPATGTGTDNATAPDQTEITEYQELLDHQSREIEDHVPATYIQTLESDTLKLQAISWSQTPCERIAVINNRVLGEKERIQGYRILKINEDEIILQGSDGQKFRLAFKSR